MKTSVLNILIFCLSFPALCPWWHCYLIQATKSIRLVSPQILAMYAADALSRKSRIQFSHWMVIHTTLFPLTLSLFLTTTLFLSLNSHLIFPRFSHRAFVDLGTRDLKGKRLRFFFFFSLCFSFTFFLNFWQISINNRISEVENYYWRKKLNIIIL